MLFGMSETGPGAVTGSRLIRGLILYVFNAVRNERDGARSGDWQQADKRVDTLRLQCCSE